MKVSRTSRLNGEYQKEISEIIRLNKDRMGLKGLISITEADVAPDLKTAIVYVSIYGKGEEETKAIFKSLQEQAGFIRHELSQVMRMRTVPALTFRLDGSMVYGAKMDELFKSITYSTPETKDED
ncbi:MAG: 30S ribosome-binding factor RbfA [Clostridia bacterium]|nr:30S ribosome-binding factor RbfA [Clostridia bacterium]